MRTILFLFSAVFVLEAQSNADRIKSLAARIHSHNQVRPPSIAGGLAAGFDEIRAALLRLENDASLDASAVLRDQRRKLVVLDAAYQGEFGRIETTLRHAGLAPDALAQKLAAWHEFSNHYRQRMDATLSGFDRLSREAASHGRDWFRSQVAGLRESLGSQATSPPTRVDSRAIPAKPVTRAPVKLDSSTLTLATDPPTPDDLAATNTVLLTPEIQARAAAYGNSPAALFAFVYNEIKFTPYYLSVQNSQSVLWSGTANDGDQATLLIALLRASGIPARYVIGNILVPAADAINWMGAKDQNGADLLIGINTYYNDMGTAISVQHAWVEAWLDTPNGQAWIPMAPSIKSQTFQPGIVMPKPSFDRTAFLSAYSTQLATEAYQDQIRAEFLQANPGGDYNDLPYTGTTIPKSASAIPSFPYPIQSIQMRSATLPSHTITLSLAAASNSNTVYLNSATLAVPDISLQSLTMTYIPATPADQAVINQYGGLANTPAALVNLLPQLLLNGQVIATGATAIPFLNNLTLTFSETFPFETSPRYVYTHSIFAGDDIAVNIGFQQISNGLLQSRMDEILSRLTADGSNPSTVDDTTIRELLSYAGLRYFQRMAMERQRVYPPLQVLPVQWYPAESVTKAAVGASNLFDRPFLATPSDSGIDCGESGAFGGVDLNAPQKGSQSPSASNPEAVAAGVVSSQLENQLWEEVELLPAISAAKAIQLASQANIPLLTITPANSATDLSTISVPPLVMQLLTNQLANGATITIPRQPVSFGIFDVYGWIADFANGAEVYYIELFGIAGGGATGGGPAKPMPPTSDAGPTGDNTGAGGTSKGDPVNISNGNLFEQQTDLTYSSRGLGIMWQRTYNSLSAASDGPFGFGWTHSYNLSLQDNQTSVTYVNESGGVYSFTLQSGTYVSPPGLDLTLTKATSGFSIRRKNGTVLSFNTAGKLQSITDRNGNIVQLTYDQSGRLGSIQDALGRSLTVTYNSPNHITGIQDFSGRQVSYTYDSDGRLVSATDAAGNITTYAYDSGAVFQNALTQVTTPAGRTTSFEYYGNNQLAAITEAGGRTMQFFYLPLANRTMFVDDRGFTTTYYYNALGNVTRVVHPDGNFAEWTYSSDAKPLTITDERGYTTSLVYDGSGNVTKVTDALGGVTQMTYEPNFNQMTSITDSRGAITQFQYDTRGNRTQVTAPLGVQYRLSYDSYGDLLTASDVDGNVWSYSYDAAGNPVSWTDPLGNTIRLQYDNLGRVTTFTNGLNLSRSARWDALGRLTGLVDPLGSSATVAYDADSNPTEVVDANSQITKFSYDAMQDLAAVTDASHGTTEYESTTADCDCTASWNTAQYSDAAGRTRSFTYDYANRLTASVDGLGNLTNFVYGASGLLEARVDANSNSGQFTYDAGGRLEEKSFSDKTSSKFAYDSNGNITSASNANTTLTFTYDQLNRMTSVADSRISGVIRYTYDHSGHRTTLTDTTGAVFRYTYDKAGRPDSVTSPLGASVKLEYDAANRWVGTEFSSGASAAIQYDAANRATSIVWSAAGNRLFQFEYTYDKTGNPTRVVDSAGTHAYQYDTLNRLISASVQQTKSSEMYRYDGAGNRTASATDPDYKYDAAGRLLEAEGVTYTYDSNGNVISREDSKGTTSYVYDTENRLISITFPGGSRAMYKYDPFGRRIEKNVNGTVTRYLYDGYNVLAEFDGSNNLLARYTHGPAVDAPLLMERGEETYYYHADRMGSVIALTDSSAKVVCTYSYDSFGASQNCPSLQNPYQFVAREFDAESGLYYMRARYYDPATGRFLTPDPLDVTGSLLGRLFGQLPLALSMAPQRLNPYSYAVNNPLVARDPSGLRPTGGDEPGWTGQTPVRIVNTPYPLGNTYNYTYIPDNGGSTGGSVYLINPNGTRSLVVTLPQGWVVLATQTPFRENLPGRPLLDVNNNLIIYDPNTGIGSIVPAPNLWGSPYGAGPDVAPNAPWNQPQYSTPNGQSVPWSTQSQGVSGQDN